MRPIQAIMKFQTDRELDKQLYSWRNEAKNVLEEICEADGMDIPKEHRSAVFDPILQHMRALVYNITGLKKCATPSVEDRVDAHADQIVFNIGAILKLGYDPEIVLQEVAKEINSRKGEMSNGKFEKYLGEKHTSQWYKADYSKAKNL
jgi:predicted HAD superfamily Cof-like phosphohydrolase